MRQIYRECGPGPIRSIPYRPSRMSSRLKRQRLLPRFNFPAHRPRCYINARPARTSRAAAGLRDLLERKSPRGAAKSSTEAQMFSLLWEAIIGLIVGAVAKFLMPGKDPGGIIITMLIGIAGSILATKLGTMIGWYQEGQTAGFIMSVVGAVVLLLIYRVIRGAMSKA